MKEIVLIFTFIFIFSSLFTVNADALTQHFQNPEFTTDISGVRIEQRFVNGTTANCFTSSFNETYLGLGSGVLLSTNDGCFGFEDTFFTLIPFAVDKFNVSNGADEQFDLATSDNFLVLDYILNDTSNVRVSTTNVDITNINSSVSPLTSSDLIETVLWSPASTLNRIIIEVPAVRGNRLLPVSSRLQIEWITIPDGTTFAIDRYDMYTFDEIQVLPDVPSTNFIRTTCGNQSNSPIEFLLNSSEGKNVNVHDFTGKDGFNCVVYQLDQTTVTRFVREKKVAVGSDNMEWIISRDLSTIKSGIRAFAPSDKREVVFDRIDNGIFRSTNVRLNDSSDVCWSVDFSNSGNASSLEFTNQIKFRQAVAVSGLSGEQYRYITPTSSFDCDLAVGLQSNQQSGFNDNFKLSCDTASFCTGNTQFGLDLDCNIFGQQDCGLLGCTTPEGEGSTCDIIVSGPQCLDNRTATNIDPNGTIISSEICGFDEFCSQGICFTQEEFDASESTLLSNFTGGVASFLGIDAVLGTNIFFIAVSFIGSIAVTLPFKNNATIVFPISFLGFITSFILIGFLPPIIGAILVFVSILMLVFLIKGTFIGGT